MVGIYCGKNHRAQGRACPECEELLKYALTRLDKCPLISSKPTCAKCPVHCYKPEMRNRIKDVMRFSGPRMLHRHPILAVLHLFDSRRAQGNLP